MKRNQKQDCGKKYISTLFTRAKSYPKMFGTIEIETATKCNRKCEYCVNSKYNRGDNHMNEKLYIKIIHNLKEIGFEGRLSPHFYNEPFLDNKLLKLIYYAKNNIPNLIIDVFTNGDFLTVHTYYKMKHAGVDKFTVTAHDALTYRQISNLLVKLNVRDISLRKSYNLYKMNRGGLLDIDTIKVDYCNYPSNYLIVNYKGEVVLCCNDFFCHHVFGDLKKENIIDVWNSTKFCTIRNELRSGIFKYDICKLCTGHKKTHTHLKI